MGRAYAITSGLAAMLALAASASGAALKPPGWGPRTSAEAAAHVKPSGPEVRPQNRRENGREPSRRLLRAWRSTSEMPYAKHVDGRYRGTTDEIIQWAAVKWGFPARVLRAVAVVESWWRMDTVGDAGDSFGLFQVRRPFHCLGECRIAHRYTAWNADYYGGILRAYFDGKMKWLNTVERGRRYEAGDLWGSVGAWFAGRWWTPPAVDYIHEVRKRMRERTWTEPYFGSRLQSDPADAVSTRARSSAG